MRYRGHLTQGATAANGPGRPAPGRTVVVGTVVVGAGVAWAVAGPRRVVVDGSSMEPTLMRGDRLLVLPRAAVGVGDIVAVRDPRFAGRILVKRVTAVEGTKVVVMGDNRASSTDSRVFGAVERRRVVGRAVYRYHPSGRTGRVGWGLTSSAVRSAP